MTGFLLVYRTTKKSWHACSRQVKVNLIEQPTSMETHPDGHSRQAAHLRSRHGTAHGAVAVKRGTFKATNFKQCLATEAPALVAFYRAAQDFRGSDQFALEVTWPDGRKQIQRFRIDVGNVGGGGGEGI